jgi:hypothetical protein
MAPAVPPSPAVVVPRTLRAAAALASAQALVECIAVAGRTGLTVGLRTLLIACIGLTWLLAWRVVRLSAGAALGLLLLEGTTLLAAFGAVDSSLGVRLALGATALAVTVLLLASLHAFPSPSLPSAARPTRVEDP